MIIGLGIMLAIWAAWILWCWWCWYDDVNKVAELKETILDSFVYPPVIVICFGIVIYSCVAD